MSEAGQTTKWLDQELRDHGNIARDGDTAARRALASDSNTRPEVLYYLAEDPDAEVRRCIAENDQTPRQANMLLAQDDNEEVRCVLAKKIGRLFPETSVTERDVIRRTVVDITEILAAYQTARVRELVSDAIKEQPDIPPHVVRQLAADPQLNVCGPILEYSPVLTDEDLLAIIATSPVQGALGAISRRSTVGESVSHAIASSDDVDAITDLLANPSAQIRDETLDFLVAGAPAVPAWHAPLVNRPVLPANAANRIAGFVADSLLGSLRQRTDLPEDVLDAIESTVTERLAEDAGNGPAHGVAENDPESAADPLYERALALQREDRLTEKLIRDAAAAGDRAMVIAALAAASGLSCKAIQNIFEMRASKGIVAVCWKAGLSMNLAYQIQITVGSIAPGAVVEARDGTDFPLSEEELHWQVKFFNA
ncbi:MAG: DUF2336 domain-containing protein [Rhodospirillaceae bacterium]|nr:DUF2336 domain-containing protein [Rhodospirillaceae bacterium]